MTIPIEKICTALIEAAPADPAHFKAQWELLPSALQARLNTRIAASDDYRTLFAGNPTLARRKYCEQEHTMLRSIAEAWGTEQRTKQSSGYSR